MKIYPAGYIAGLLVFGFFGGAAVYTATTALFQDETPTFAVGDCVQVDTHFERWESPTVIRIVEIGAKTYRRAFWVGIPPRWVPEDSSDLTFGEARRMYVKVPCHS